MVLVQRTSPGTGVLLGTAQVLQRCRAAGESQDGVGARHRQHLCFPSVLAPSPGAGQVWHWGTQPEPFAFAWVLVELRSHGIPSTLLLAPTSLLHHGAGNTFTNPDQHAAASVLPD